jgi:hypothetical protein
VIGFSNCIKFGQDAAKIKKSQSKERLVAALRTDSHFDVHAVTDIPNAVGREQLSASG